MEDPDFQKGDQKSIIGNIINQLRQGTELTKITLPTFVLEPRSMCERLSDFLSHQDLLFDMQHLQPQERFLRIVKYYLVGFHIRPQGVRKPFNPILGEFFRAQYRVNDCDAFWVCEQVSHHPPATAYFYSCPKQEIAIQGEIHPKAKFSGNSASTLMEGGFTISVGKHQYELTAPNIYARGILFGRMFMELGDTVTITGDGFTCEIEFKVRGMFTDKEDDKISAKIKQDGKTLHKITGSWSGQMYISSGNQEKVLFVDVNALPIHAKIVSPLQDQEEYESRNLWQHVASAIIKDNQYLATVEKTKIEDNQRRRCKLREALGVKWQWRFFETRGDRFVFKWQDQIPRDPEKATQFVKDRIFERPQQEMHQSFWMPPEDDGLQKAK
ncbi:hypothetical protein EDD86DRAFT_202834, partial [Gorgonomyces haynaldii]